MLRREWFKKLVQGLIAASLVLVPLGTGILFFLDPLRRRSQEREFLHVAPLDSLLLDTPLKFTLMGNRTDAWQTSSNVPIGVVYLIRREQEVDAFQVICPHAGCFVEYDPGGRQFLCPCHNSAFGLDGSIVDSADNPSARGLDKLEAKIEGDQVFVRYQEFRQGIEEKVEVS